VFKTLAHAAYLHLDTSMKYLQVASDENCWLQRERKLFVLGNWEGLHWIPASVGIKLVSINFG
jgi:hypothetical protein